MSESLPSDLIPTEGWLADYVSYARRHAMAPDQFHLACGLAALSAIAGVAMYLPIGPRRYYGTFWGILCGPAGRARKTSAIGLAMDLVDEVIPDLQLPRDFSREALLEAVSQNPTGVLELDEFGGFMAKASRDYMSGVKQDLSGMWEARSGTRKTMKHEYKIHRPRLTIIGGCPLDDMLNFMRYGDLKQGFVSRLLFFMMDPEEDVRYVAPHGLDREARSRLIEPLHTFAKLRQEEDQFEIELTARVRAQFEEKDEQAGKRADVAAPEMSAWESRRGVWIAKLGMLFSLSLTGTPVMDPEELERADWLMEIMAEQMRELVEEVPIAGDRNADKRRLVRQRALSLARRGSAANVVSRRELFNSLKRHIDSTQELDRMMNVLVEAGDFERGQIRVGERGKSAVAFRYLNGVPPPEGWQS